MKKRFTAFALVFGMLINQSIGFVSAAESEKNAYGHSIKYEPVTQLYTGGEPVKFFDAAVTQWEDIRDEAKAIKWLSENNYLLNHFGRYFSGVEMKDCFNSKGEWQMQMKGPRNVRRWDANISFTALTEKEQRENGNISAMFDKGDLQYLFSRKVKTVQTKWGLTGQSNDTGLVLAFGEWIQSKGGGWHKYNTLGDGPNLYDTFAWKNADSLNLISFMAQSDKDNRVDSYMSGAMLVGKDIQGPRISSVRVTSDIEGKKEIENGTVTLDTIDKLDDRTVYFQVEWDEPVMFRGISSGKLKDLSLKINTIGIDGTSGIIAEAPFLKFAPSKKDSKPVMVFEYKIADPYTDYSSVTQERGYFYKFSNVSVSEQENNTLWNYIYDISGNKFAADADGLQPSGKVVSIVSGAPKVDLTPFGIKNIRMKKTDGNTAYIAERETLGINLKLNKSLAGNIKKEDLPKITLNVTDPDGKNVTLEPCSFERDCIKYRTWFKRGYKADGETVKVVSVSAVSDNVKDESGYKMMNYAADGNGMLVPTDIPSGAKSKISLYSVSPDKQYKLDFDAPSVELSVNDGGGGVISVTASVEDSSLEGCEVSFTAKMNGTAAGEGISAQASASETYNDSEWKKGENGATIAAFCAPVINTGGKGNAYGFVKLPQSSEADKITVSAAVIDEAGNSTTAEKEFSAPEWSGFDTLAPTVNAIVNDEKVSVDISDIDDEITYMYGFSENETDEPSYTSANGKQGDIAPPELPEGNTIHTRVLWIKAKDSHGNESGVSKFTVKYDRTYTDITCTSEIKSEYLSGDKPLIFYKVENAVSFWYVWAEKPANVSDTATYIADKYLDVMKSRAVERRNVFDPETNKNPVAELSEDTLVAVINPEDESYSGDFNTDVTASETSRPIMFVVGAEREDGTTLIKTIELNTFYSAPKATVRQTRFSTNNSTGQRLDYVRNSENGGLIWADDEYENPTNTPDLYGFAQAEIQLVGDPVTKLDRVDTKNCSVALKKVVYKDECSETNIISSNIIKEWTLGELNFGSTMSAVLDIDINDIDAKYHEIAELVDEESGDEYTQNRIVRYELECNMAYKGGIAAKSEPITYFAFNNTPHGFIHSTQYDTGRFTMQYRKLNNYEKKNVEAVFDRNGNDVTSDIPVYTVSTTYPEMCGYSEYICFSGPAGDFYDGDNSYYNTPVLNKVDPNNTVKLKMYIGTDPENLSETLNFTPSYYEYLSEFFDIGRYLFGDESELRQVKLYYRFEHSERGTLSPLYVMIIRRDNVAPVMDFSVSETEKRTNEVLVKLNSVSDTQTAADGTVVVDTSESEPVNNWDFLISAFREATEDDDLDEFPYWDIDQKWISDTDTYKYYVRVYPDKDGIYHFTSNGYICPRAADNAQNYNEEITVNGKTVELTRSEGDDFPCYYINNVSNAQPEFVTEPTFTEDDGRFTVNAKADNTVKNVYLKFDTAYSNLLLDNASADGAQYDIKNVPGIVSGGFNGESGEISTEIYVKHSDSVPLSKAVLVIENDAGNKTEYPYDFKSPIYGKKAEITNAKKNGYPVWKYGETLDFSTPVKLDGKDGYALSHGNLAIYSDGAEQITYTDLFGESRTETVYADIFGTAFNHSLIFTANGAEISPKTPVSTDVSVKIDTKNTQNLSVDGGKTEYIFSENGILTYSLTNSELGQTKEFNIPITNIDKTSPEAIVNFSAESETDAETGAKKVYSVTYSIEGFSEDGVMMIPTEDGAAPSAVTFEYGSADKKYAFRFRDTAGNVGTYTADATDIAFAQRADNKITSYRLTYTTAAENGFNTIAQIGANEKLTNIEPVNKAVSVKAEGLNKNGETVPSALSVNGTLPDGAAVYAKEKLVMFTTESSEERVVNLTLSGAGGEISVPVILPSDTIDLTAPSGTVMYKPDGENVKAYLVTNDTDLAEDGVYVTGTKSDGTALELKSDGNGYYTEFDINGAGRFVMTDKSGNIGTVAIAVLTIDKEPPQIVSEGWQSLTDAKTQEEIEKLLNTPTNSTIKLFMTFNEQLRGAEVKAFKSIGEAEELLPTEEYVTAITSGSTLTVEFLQNCRAKLTVYDLRGNALTLWRPEDGPITVIDRDIPKPAEGYPKRIFENNTVKLEYIFADDEEVMLLQNHESGYKNSHTVTVSENGTQILNFADKSGNVFSDYPVITEIDNLAPDIKINMDFVGDGAELSGNDSYMAGNFYTSKDVRILLNVTDTTADGISVFAKTKSGKPIAVKAENVTKDGKAYNYNFVVSENGSYTVTAKDKWGNENLVETSISVIDKTAPTIKLNGNAVIKSGTSGEDAKAEILKLVTAVDTQSGAESPLGSKGDILKNLTAAVKKDADLSKVNLDKEGIYTAKVTARDRLRNTAEKELTVTVVKDVYTFSINGVSAYANDVFTSEKGKISLNGSSQTAKYYYAKGYKSAAQMKYAKGFDPNDGFDASQNGYYTILAQESNRKMYLLYVYIY